MTKTKFILQFKNYKGWRTYRILKEEERVTLFFNKMRKTHPTKPCRIIEKQITTNTIYMETPIVPYLPWLGDKII